MLPIKANDPKINFTTECRHVFVHSGSYFRKCDQTQVQRFRCKFCGFSRSTATQELFYRQRRRNINAAICLQLTSGVSQRRCALIVPANRKTVVRKFRFFAEFFELMLKFQNSTKEPVHNMQFDDLETYEHTKCKPLSVTLAVENKSRRVLGFEVSQMPCKGRLAKLSVLKYGPRADERGQARDKLFSVIKPYLDPQVIIQSDDNPHYSKQVKEYFPQGTHITTLGGRGSSSGQGELKRKAFDPLFSINHTFAKLRDDIKRLARKNWCTTKKPDQLRINITMMVVYHNYRLHLKDLKNKSQKQDKENIFNDIINQCIPLNTYG